MLRRVTSSVTFTLALVLLAAMSSQAGTIYDANADYLAGWTTGNNPNGVWIYGWSTTPGSGFHLYTVHGNQPYPQVDSWNDPTNFIATTPIVYFNTGAVINNGNLHNLPAGALVIHGGGTAAACGTKGSCFSEILWTAPVGGIYNLSATFTGRQFALNGLVEIIDVSHGVPTTLLSGSIFDQTSQSLAAQIAVLSGDTLTFASRSNVGLSPDTTQFDATLTYVSPEPSTLGLLCTGLVTGIGILRRKLTL